MGWGRDDVTDLQALESKTQAGVRAEAHCESNLLQDGPRKPLAPLPQENVCLHPEREPKPELHTRRPWECWTVLTAPAVTHRTGGARHKANTSSETKRPRDFGAHAHRSPEPSHLDAGLTLPRFHYSKETRSAALSQV